LIDDAMLQDVLKHVEETEQLPASESEQVQSVELATREKVSTGRSHTTVDPRYVQLLGDKAAVCCNIIIPYLCR